MTEYQRRGQPSAIPDDEHRWRCGACGNLTRFDVVRSARTQEFWHLDLAGAASVEVEQVLSDDLVSVSCRWCGRGDQIREVTRPGVESS